MLILNYKTYEVLKNFKKNLPKTYEHSLNVALLCDKFGQNIGLDEKDIEKLKIAALLHDIGKLEIPINILNKPSKLTHHEYNIIKNHPLFGVKLLLNSEFSDKEILDIILCHHERPDGLGYPNRLTDKDIPYLAKILSICDSYDAMKSIRSYKDEKSLEYIKKEFIKNSNTQFDGDLVNLFLKYLNNNSLENQNKI